MLTPWPGRSPKDIEDQVTYPLSVSLLAVPGAESVRGKSMFGYSFVQVTFKDSVDSTGHGAGCRKQLGSAAAQLPDGGTPQLGPDATGLGQVYYYVLTPPPEGMSLAELRSIQDFVVKYELQAVEGVSEVASIGGYVRQYQIEVDPDLLRFHNVPLDQVVQAVRARTSTSAPRRSRRPAWSSSSEERVSWGAVVTRPRRSATSRRPSSASATACRSASRTSPGSSSARLPPRRARLQRLGSRGWSRRHAVRENPRAVIDRVKERIEEITPSLSGVTIHGVYGPHGPHRRDRRDALLLHCVKRSRSRRSSSCSSCSTSAAVFWWPRRCRSPCCWRSSAWRRSALTRTSCR